MGSEGVGSGRDAANALASECAAYLQAMPGAGRVMEALRRRYIALGHPGGKIHLASVTPDEVVFLRGLCKRDFPEGEDAALSVKGLIDAFGGTRFAGVELLPLLEVYFGEKILSNKERDGCAKVRREDFFQQLIEGCGHHSLVGEWLHWALANPTTGDYQWLEGLYQNEPEALEVLVAQLGELVVWIEGTEECLARPVLAAQITKDPHGLDDQTPLYKALLYYLRHRYDWAPLETAGARRQLLSLANIDTDSASNNLPSYGLRAWDHEGEVMGWLDFCRRRETLVLTGGNLAQVRQIAPAGGQAVFCFENLAVFHTFTRQLPGQACLCTGGQLNRTALRLLEILQESQVPVYYHGDYDPEGLIIADKLCRQFVNVQLIAYEPFLYERAKSGQAIPEKRLKQLDKLTVPELIAIARLLRQTRQAGYQEYIIEALLEIGRGRHGDGAAGVSLEIAGKSPITFFVDNSQR